MRKAEWTLALLVAACAGGRKEAQEPVVEVAEEEVVEEEPADDELVPPEKFDELDSAFNLKRPEAARCYRRGVEEGKVSQKDEGRVTLRMTISAEGKARNVEVAGSTLKNEYVERCLVEMVRGWSLPAPGADVPFSYSYDFEYNW